MASLRDERMMAPLVPLIGNGSVYSNPVCSYLPMHGTPADCAIMVDPILSPRARMGGPGGPMN